MILTKDYRVVVASGWLTLRFNWQYSENGSYWWCDLDKGQADVLISIFDIPPSGFVGEIKEFSKLMGGEVKVHIDAERKFLLTEDDFGYQYYDDSNIPRPPPSVNLKKAYNKKIQKAAKEMGIDWRPGQEIPEDLMYYLHTNVGY